MAGFLRRLTSDAGKSKQSGQGQQPSRPPPVKTEAPLPSVPPLFARFATSTTSLSAPSVTPLNARAVSGPMPLNGNWRNGSERVMASGRRDGDAPARQRQTVESIDSPAVPSQYGNTPAMPNTIQSPVARGHAPHSSVDKPLPAGPVPLDQPDNDSQSTSTTQPPRTSMQVSRPDYLDKKPLPQPAPTRQPSLPRIPQAGPSNPPSLYSPAVYASTTSPVSPSPQASIINSLYSSTTPTLDSKNAAPLPEPNHRQEYTLSFPPPTSTLPGVKKPSIGSNVFSDPPSTSNLPSPVSGPPRKSSQPVGQARNQNLPSQPPPSSLPSQTANSSQDQRGLEPTRPPKNASVSPNGTGTYSQAASEGRNGNRSAPDFASGTGSQEPQQKESTAAASFQPEPPRRSPSYQHFPPPASRSASKDRLSVDPMASVTSFTTQSTQPSSAVHARSSQTPPTSRSRTPSKTDRRYPLSTSSNIDDLGNSKKSQGQGPTRNASMRSISETPLNAPARSGPLIFAAMSEEPQQPKLFNRPSVNRLPSAENISRGFSGDNGASAHQNAAALYGASFPRPLDTHGQAPPHSQSPGYQQPYQNQPSTQRHGRKLSKAGASGRPPMETPASQSHLHSQPLSSRTSQPSVNGTHNGVEAESHNYDRASDGHRVLTKGRHSSVSPSKHARKPSYAWDSEYEPMRNPVLNVVDNDPFAKSEGVKMLDQQRKPPPTDHASAYGPSVNGNSKPQYGSADGTDRSRYPSTPVSPGYRQITFLSPTTGNTITPERKRGRRPEDVAPLAYYLADPELLSSLLSFFTFYDWCTLWSISKYIRTLLNDDSDLRETVLERYLRTVGYRRWIWGDSDPLSLSLEDLNAYMREVSTPMHQYAQVAQSFIQSVTSRAYGPSLAVAVRHLAASTRAYTRVVLRLRAQAESEHENPTPPPPSDPNRLRAPSPSPSSYSHSQHGHSAPRSFTANTPFRSPLFRLRRAPLLHVFVPSPDGDWLSDRSVLECEAELKKAGVSGMLRTGDVVWDVAVGDDGNVGRLVWDGAYLIDLDYSYSPVGDLPKYLHGLAFPPSYFHRVIRTGPSMSNPIIHIDISPWGKEIAANLQLLQDTIRTETPQGNHHNVVRWLHRSSFDLRRPPKPPRQPYHTSPPQAARVPIPGTGLFVDPGWYGTVIVEAEGTNEGLADLQRRCGSGAFPPHTSLLNSTRGPRSPEDLKVFRILRERSRPGEIWIRAVSPKERLL